MSFQDSCQGREEAAKFTKQSFLSLSRFTESHCITVSSLELSDISLFSVLYPISIASATPSLHLHPVVAQSAFDLVLSEQAGLDWERRGMQIIIGLQPEKNKLVFFGKKRFFSRKKHSLKKTAQNFVFFIFKHLFTFYCFLNYKKWLTVLILCLELG